MADKPDKQTREDLGKMRRVKLRELAVIYGKSNTECSNAQSNDLIDFILAAQDGKKVVAKKGKEEPARGKGKAEPEEDAEEEAPRGRGKTASEPEEEEEEAPRGRRGSRREEPEEEAPRGRRGRREEPEAEEEEEKAGGASDEKIDALGKTLDEMGEQVTELRKSNFVIMGMLREVCADFMKKGEIDTMIEELEADFEKGNE
jgi:FtsZ-interacting cell division protein YlmF